MYPPLPNSYFDIEKRLQIPLPYEEGREIDIFISGTYEGDTNATILDEENATIRWVDTGEDLTADELNIIIKAPDTTLNDWIMNNLD